MSKKDLINSITNPDNLLASDAQSGDMTAEETLLRKYSGIVTEKRRLTIWQELMRMMSFRKE